MYNLIRENQIDEQVALSASGRWADAGELSGVEWLDGEEAEAARVRRLPLTLRPSWTLVPPISGD